MGRQVHVYVNLIVHIHVHEHFTNTRYHVIKRFQESYYSTLIVIDTSYTQINTLLITPVIKRMMLF